MKKNLVILANVLIVLSILAFVLLYTGSEARKALAAQVDASRTVMEMEAPCWTSPSSRPETPPGPWPPAR